MKDKDGYDFVGRRSDALALILLSNRPGLTVMTSPEHAGVDLIVSVVRKKVRIFNHFGVIVKGSAEEIPNAAEASRLLSRLVNRDAARAPLLMPVCIFLFSMVGDQGYYAWLREPVASGGLPRLNEHATMNCKRLDRAALQSIVDNVNSYFDALARVLVF